MHDEKNSEKSMLERVTRTREIKIRNKLTPWRRTETEIDDNKYIQGA